MGRAHDLTSSAQQRGPLICKAAGCQVVPRLLNLSTARRAGATAFVSP